MKVIIEKKLESLKDLRLAQKSLKKKAKIQEERLKLHSENLQAQISPKQLYTEALDSFNVNSLLLELLPYALRYKDQLTNNPIVDKLSKIDKKKLPVIVGSLTALGFFSYSFFKKKKATGNKEEGTPNTAQETNIPDADEEYFV